jgi:hypothetical protein
MNTQELNLRNEGQMIILEVLINNFHVKAHSEEDLDLTDKWLSLLCCQNAIFEHLLYNMDYDCECNEEMTDYMLRATYKEAANYYLEVFLPNFKNK